jgi:hypothetical protein
MRNDAIWSRFEVPTETIVGPPFPTDPFAFLVTDAVPSDILSIRMRRATKIASGGEAGIALTGEDSGVDTEPGFAGAVRASWNEPFRPFESTAFDMQVDISAVSGVEPVPFLPALPAITPTSTGFLLTYEVRFFDDRGAIARTSQRQMPIDAFAGQEVTFANVSVSPPEPALTGGTAGFRVTFDLVDAGDVDAGEPLFELSFTADCQPASAVTSIPTRSDALGGQALVARPSVTGAGCDLRLARPADVAGSIDLFEVSGRRITSLVVPAGSSGRYWDGLDSGGRPAAAGVYFARWSDGRHDLRARIVRVR